MFARGKTTETTTGQEPSPDAVNQIMAGTKIIGEITTDSHIMIAGYLKGNLIAKGKVVIGQTGEIVGDIDCKNADILGKVDGKIKVTELLSLKETANIKSDVITGKLHIEPGAVFNGTCSMNGGRTSVADENNNVRKTRQEQKA